MRHFFFFIAVFLTFYSTHARAQPAPDLSWPALFHPYRVLSIHLELPPEDWDTIRRDRTNTVKVTGTMTVEGSAPMAISVRRKSSRGLPNEDDPQKVGLKVDIDNTNGVSIGVKKLSLENGADSGPVKEGIAWALHQMAAPAGQKPALAAWVAVHVNGQYLGVYVNNEQRDKTFLRNRGIYEVASTWMYKQDDIGLMERDVAPTEEPTSASYDSGAFKALCFSPFQPAPVTTSTKTKGTKASTTCSTPADGALSTALNGWIDMDGMLRQGAVDTVIDNGDGLFSQGKNFFVIDKTGAARMYVPWDLDGVFRNTGAGIYGVVGKGGKVTQTPYQQVILNHPEMRPRYNAILQGLLNDGGALSASNLRTLLSGTAAAVTPHLLTDPYHAATAGDFALLESWLRARATSILRQVAANGPPAPR